MTSGRPPIDPRTGRPRQPPRRPNPNQPRRVTAASRTPPPSQRPRPDGQRPTPRRAHQPPPPPEPRAATLKMGSPRRRLRITMFGLLFAFSLLAGRLFQLQAVDAGGYAKAAATAREATEPLYATRGAILAANGTPLAVSVEAYDVTTDPTMVAKYHEDVSELASKLSPILAEDPEYAGQSTASQGIDVKSLTAALSDTKTQYRLLASQVSPATWAKIAALTASNTYDSTNVGLYRNRDDRRTYPGGELASNVVGFTSGTGVGRGGIEQMLNSKLQGVNGQMSYQAASGIEIPTAGINLKPAVDGTSVQTTIDPDLQWEAEQAILAEVKASNATSGTVVVEDVATGHILALADAPTFDPTHITQADVPNIGNRAFTDPYEPGSVAKVITMAAAIQLGVATPETGMPPFGSGLECGGTTFHDDNPHGLWDLTMTGVLARSSNLGTIELSDMFAGKGVPRDQTIYNYQRLFGLGSTTGIGFPGESAGIIHPPSTWSDTTHCTVVFGQGMSVTAVQMASVYQTIANGGVRIAPTLVSGYVDPSGKVTPAPAPARTQVVSASTASKVAQMLEAVVTSPDGTGPAGGIPGYRVAGKTGTANRVDPATGKYSSYTASFIGFAPTDKPSIVVGVEVQVSSGNHFGAQLAAPVFKQVMSFALQSRDVPPTGTPNANLPTTY
jgi:cell division protein FtsI (penicillin-binding protein 3)